MQNSLQIGAICFYHSFLLSCKCHSISGPTSRKKHVPFESNQFEVPTESALLIEVGPLFQYRILAVSGYGPLSEVPTFHCVLRANELTQEIPARWPE